MTVHLDHTIVPSRGEIDCPRGRLLTRREALTLLGSAGATMLSGSASRLFAAEAPSACIATPEQTEGPYFVEEKLNRADIRSDPADGSVKEGLPLTLKLVVAGVAGGKCAPLPGAIVDIWHCDMAGAYSDATDQQFDTRGKKFLRGYQVTDANGGAQFTTIYPGWYEGRAVHIHFKVRGVTQQQRRYEFTSQFYFDDAFSDRVFSQAPYAKRGRRAVRNERDGLFRDGGNRLILPVTENASGYAANFNVGISFT